jgi:hypothetical protein
LHSLGIGAATYLRRAVENQWETLVQECREAAAKLRPATDLSIFDRALENRRFECRLSLLENGLPEKLLILEMCPSSVIVAIGATATGSIIRSRLFNVEPADAARWQVAR